MESELDPKWGEYSPLHDPRILANFKARSTDVLITTAPKAGTTWMQQILYQIKTGGDPDFDNIDDVVPWLELPHGNCSWQQLLEKYEQLPAPRIFKTHCTYPQTPHPDKVKIILSSRDPRDCCVSFYHHMISMKQEALDLFGIKAPESFDEYFEDWMSFGAWYRNVASWWPHKNDPNVLWFRYEDMVRDLSDTIEQILDFLGWTLTEKQKQNVLQYSSFNWMRDHNDKFVVQFDNGESMFKPKGFIRKGQIGDHKNLMSKKQEDRILERAKQELPEDCLRFLELI